MLGWRSQQCHRNSPLGEEVEQDVVFELSVGDVLVIHAWTRRKHILNHGPETHRARTRQPGGPDIRSSDKLLEIGGQAVASQLSSNYVDCEIGFLIAPGLRLKFNKQPLS